MDTWRGRAKKGTIKNGRIVAIADLDGGEDGRRELTEDGYDYVGLIPADQRYRIHIEFLKSR